MYVARGRHVLCSVLHVPGFFFAMRLGLGLKQVPEREVVETPLGKCVMEGSRGRIIRRNEERRRHVLLILRSLAGVLVLRGRLLAVSAVATLAAGAIVIVMAGVLGLVVGVSDITYRHWVASVVVPVVIVVVVVAGMLVSALVLDARRILHHGCRRRHPQPSGPQWLSAVPQAPRPPRETHRYMGCSQSGPRAASSKGKALQK